ncbi:MAG TPA: glycosyltransferase family 39 protein [Chloroflexia bacterium]|nr:glycosyltransferase family 39 protein [Chloroflexia bacterium]
MTRLDRPLTAVLVLATLVRLYAWWQAPRMGFVIDEAEYYQIAHILADGRGWSFYDAATWIRPPLYPLMLAGIFVIFGHSLVIIRLVQIALSVATVYLLYRLGYRAFGRRTGLMAGILAAIAWPFAVLSYLLLSETLFLFLFLLAVNFLLEYIITGKDEPLSRASGPIWRQKRIWYLVGAGVSLGLSALTRGQVLSFMPFIGLWLLVALGWRQWRKALLSFVVVAVAFVLVIAPWTFRNYTVYGRPFIDTTGGYNFYLGALDGRNGARVSQDLEAVKNQADRETLGYQKGLQVMFNNPANFIKKGFKESLDFWNINFGADERLEGGYTKGLIPSAWLIPDQLLGDTLYIITGVLALLGLVVARHPTGAPDSGIRSFVIIWVLYNMALAFAFFAVSRFRLPVYFFLLLFAAYVLANHRRVLRWLGRPLQLAGRSLKGGRVAAALVLPLIFLIIVLPTYVPGETLLGIQEWNMQKMATRGDELRSEGKYTDALQSYARSDLKSPYTQIGIGLTEAILGRYDAAIGRIGRTSQDIAESHLALGWIYLRQGKEDYAHGEFRSRQIALDNQADSWAWDNLPTRPLPDNKLTIGEFDWGYVKGFHIYEKQDNKPDSPYYRWTSDRGETGWDTAKLRFPLSPDTKVSKLTITLNGFRPTNLTPPTVEIFANGQSLGKVTTTRQWKTYTLNLPQPIAGPGEAIIELAPSSTFVPGADSRRELGVMVQSAQLLP